MAKEFNHKKASDDEIIRMAKERRYAEGMMTEMMRRLKDSVNQFNQQSSEQANEMIKLNASMKYLTTAIILVMLIQIIVAM
jgi:hypothetical protein